MKSLFRFVRRYCSAPISLPKYIAEVKPTLKPPVSNRMIYNEQLQLMVVGGPNQRKVVTDIISSLSMTSGFSYQWRRGLNRSGHGFLIHLHHKEIFFQIDGAMNVDILEKGEHKTIHIPQGHFFILPSRIPHSPQRFPLTRWLWWPLISYANTIGIVVERLRKSTEHDGLRYFIPGTTKVLYEEYFQCKDLGSELVPVINRFVSHLLLPDWSAPMTFLIDFLPLSALKQMFQPQEW